MTCKETLEAESSYHGSVVTNMTNIPEDAGLIPGLAQWIKDLVLHELCCRLQTQLGSHGAVAVAVAGSSSPDSTVSLGTAMCGPKKSQKRKKKERKKHWRQNNTWKGYSETQE